MPARLARDTQRARVYRAELPMPPSPLPGLPACGAFAARVVGTLWWHARFPDHTLDRMPRLRPGNGARTAYLRDEDDGHSITLPRRYRTKGVMLHELAHWALDDQPDLPAHGATFTRLLLDATDEFCGAARADELRAAYVAERVRIGEAPRVGPDGRWRYGCDERLRLSRHRRVTIHAHGQAPVVGVLDGLEARGSTAVLGCGDDQRRVAVSTVWAVEAAR